MPFAVPSAPRGVRTRCSFQVPVEEPLHVPSARQISAIWTVVENAIFFLFELIP